MDFAISAKFMFVAKLVAVILIFAFLWSNPGISNTSK